MKSISFRRRRQADGRRGAVAVEFAAIAPLFVIIALGMFQTAQLFEARNLLCTAAREGARMAAMDREGLVKEGVSTNQFVIQNIKTYLTASGVDTTDLTIEIVHHENPEVPFDLDDPANDYELFEVHLELPYLPGAPGAGDFNLSTKVCFRNAQAHIAQ